MGKLKIDYEKAWFMGIDPIATGKQLRQMRRQYCETQESLSALFSDGGDSVSKNAISTWETGKKLPSLSHIVFLAELYGCSLDDLIITYSRSYAKEDKKQRIPIYSEIYC